MYYTGIGSRETPPQIQFTMIALAKKLAKLGLTLRSGGANGADTAFERGAQAENGKREIYLPYRGFNRSTSGLYGVDQTALDKAKEVWEDRYINGSTFCTWNVLKEGTRKMMARNCYQVLGVLLDSKSSIVACWTKDGKASGGTGQAIWLAVKEDIPVMNLYYKEMVDLAYNLIEGNIKFNDVITAISKSEFSRTV